MIMSAKEVNNKIYKELVNATSPYLGPSSERFIDRQIRNHLDKEPLEVKRSDINLLIDWLRLSMNILTDDDNLVKEYITKIQKLRNAK